MCLPPYDAILSDPAEGNSCVSTIAGLHTSSVNRMRYLMSPDERPFHFVKRAGAGAQNDVVVALHWFDELICKVGQ